MTDRTYGETRDCKGCRYWSEMAARCLGLGPVQALCLNRNGPLSMVYTAGSDTCVAWASGDLGPVDDPGGEPDYDSGLD